MAKEEVNEYERQRRANIAERQALIKQLALDSVAAAVQPKLAKRPLSNGTNKSKKPAVKKVKEVLPTRTSSRLAGLTADSEVAKRKAEDVYEAAQEAARIKRQRVSGDLDLKDIVVAGKGWDSSLVDVVSRGAQPYERTFGETEIKETTDKELKALREQMSGLELYEEWEPNRIKICPERIYSMAFHPSESKPLIFAGDKLGNLGIFDASQLPSDVVKPEKKTKKNVKSEDSDEDEEDKPKPEDKPDPEITSLHLHTRTICAMYASPAQPSHLYTASYDSSIRLLDLTKSTSTEVYGPADRLADEPLSGIEIDPMSPHILYFSRLDGFIGRHDTRVSSATQTETWQCSEKKIGGFSIHPQYPHFLTTASLDRTMRLWDLRKMNGKGANKTPTVVGEHVSRLSVSHAAFNSVGQIATASYDDTVKIHSFPSMSTWAPGHTLEEEAMEPTSVIRHNNQTGRWVTILRAQWQRQPPGGIQRFAIGNMNRFVDIYSGEGKQLAQLGGGGITAVPAVAVFHPTMNWVAGGTASAKLCLWM